MIKSGNRKATKCYGEDFGEIDTDRSWQMDAKTEGKSKDIDK
jgi:hypothetical protein